MHWMRLLGIVAPLARAFAPVRGLRAPARHLRSFARFEEAVPGLSPTLLEALAGRGITKPSPIQRDALPILHSGESAVLAAETGSGKSLAFLLPTLALLKTPVEGTAGSGVMDADLCVLVLAPTRELALQLATVAKQLLDADGDSNDDAVQLLVVGGTTSAKALGEARCIVATPKEALVAFSNPKVTRQLQRVRSVVLDEVDALLPPPKKDYRSEETKKRAQAKGEKKKMGRKASNEYEVGCESEAFLKLVLRGNSRPALQIVGASATASRKTLELLRSVVRQDPYGRFSKKELTIIRVGSAADEAALDEAALAAGDDADKPDLQQAPRGVVVPRAVAHRYAVAPRGCSDAVAMQVIADALAELKPRSALVFLSTQSGFTVGKALAALQQCGVPAAVALHEALALDKGNRLKREGPEEVPRTAGMLTSNHAVVASQFQAVRGDKTPVFVTFEASARGLHFDAVDVVFVVGVPNSASSYLHLAGRTGRRLGDVVHPGTVVTVCPPRAVSVLESWSKQLGDVEFAPLFGSAAKPSPAELEDAPV
ncbi:P-loop containing nucleoside triphosphate hydrolase protein [Pelagophyceae sp. CCMP2097]|nr:P-loop containing nucleoside triphosphate hydrolase protein [Pelagophyceae sp. CCMP2097]